MGKRTEYVIPKELIIPLARAAGRELGRCADNWDLIETERLVKQKLGPEFAHVPVEDVRKQCLSLRKGSKLGSIKGHGPSKMPEISDELKKHYESDYWFRFRIKVKEFWGCRCALCNSERANEVHHRTYERIGHEELTDCILLCRNCHKAADQRRRRESARGDGEPQLFPA